MRVVLQRVSEAEVAVAEDVVAAIGPGLLALVGAARGDTPEQARALGRQAARIRVFDGSAGSLVDGAGALLVVSQFTLLADTRSGRRPSWSRAAPREEAEPLVGAFADGAAAEGVPVAMGRFGSHMRVRLVNDGPVTLVVESDA